MEQKNKYEILKTVLEDVQNQIFDDSIIETLLEEKVSVDPALNKTTFGQRAADKLAKFAGSWRFIIIFSLILMTWIIINIYFLSQPFDPYPFILLNLVLSCLAAIQAPVIMMSQNRQEEKDRQRNENDYRVNLKTEFIIEDLHDKIDELIENQRIILKHIKTEDETN